MRVIPSFVSRVECAEILEHARESAFVPGRQGTGYHKSPVGGGHFRAIRDRCLAELGLPPGAQQTDAYLIRFPTGSHVPVHIDPVDGGEHRRMNVVVANAQRGGQLYVGGIWYSLRVGDAYVFRPDAEEHAVDYVEDGERLVFSVGALVAA